MESVTIKTLLEKRGAWLKGESGNQKIASKRAALTKKIANNYLIFEQVRDRIFRATEAFMRHIEIVPETLDVDGHDLIEDMLKHGLLIKEEHGHEVCETNGKRYLSGGWLEELAWLAVMDSGACEAVFGQVLGWTVRNFSGENEIDLIARRGDVLGFVSCKALRSELDMHDRKHRHRLMDAVHEADNLADHFGQPGERVAVLITTDLFDELKDAPRYNALMGKAAVLDVRIISLEDLGWDRLVLAFQDLWEDRVMETVQ